MLGQSQIEKYLGRSLTTTEATNFSLYLNIATSRLEQLLCMDLSSDTPVRTYDGRIGYKTLFVDPFTELKGVTVNGVLVPTTDYVPKLWDNRNASWFNSIVFNDTMTGDVEVEAEWGFDSCPQDLKLLLAKLFALNSSDQSSNQVKSKKIEDFTVVMKDAPTEEELLSENSGVIKKYSLCNVRSGTIRHGDIDEYKLRLREGYRVV